MPAFIHSLFISIRILDIIDILLVALLLYQIYMLIRGTVAINIFVGIFLLYIFWLVVKALNMELLSDILGQVIGVGIIALIIVFQQEIRRFLLIIGSRYLTKRTFSLERLLSFKGSGGFDSKVNIEAIVRACRNMSDGKVGGIITISMKSSLQIYAETGDIINAETSSRLIESIFFKNSPMHDGAMIIKDELIFAVRCILPLTEKTNLPASYGLRHRAAIGITDITDALVVIVSEETGRISFVEQGVVTEDVSIQKLRELLEKRLIDS